MKKILTIATFALGLSTVAGSVYAANNNDILELTKSSKPVSLEEIAKEKGITLDELMVQFEKEEKLTEGTTPTSSTPTSSIETEVKHVETNKK